MNRLVGWLVAFAFVGQASAGDIRVSIQDTSAMRGAMLSIPILADSSLTGKNATAFQFEIQFNGYYVQVDTVHLNGTLSAAAGLTLNFNRVGNDRVAIAAAGLTPLAGTGALVFIRFKVKQSGYTQLAFTDALHNMLNEGEPTLTLENGSLSIAEPPTILVQPNSEVLAVGEERTFYAYYGTAPYTWSSITPSVATVDSLGNVMGISRGVTRIVAQDALGLIDTIDGVVEVRAMKVTVADTTVYSGSMFDLPIRITSVNGLNITSGRISIQFNGDVIRPVSVSTTGGILDGYGSITTNTGVKGKVVCAFAGPESLSGSGILLSIRFEPLTENYSSIAFTEALFNEDLPAKIDDGSVSVQSHASIYVNPSSADIIAGETKLFTASNGVPPYTWSTTDSLVATIDQNGLLTAKRSGVIKVHVEDSVGASGNTYDLSVYDLQVSMPQSFVLAGGVVSVPVRIDKIGAGNNVLSYQMKVTFDSTVIHYNGYDDSGSLSVAWATSVNDAGNSVTIARAASSGFASSGVLIKLRFRGNPAGVNGNYSALNFAQFMFNEGTPLPFKVNGSLSLGAAPQTPTQYGPGMGATDVSVTPTMQWSSEQYVERYHLQIATDTTMSALVVDDSTISITYIEMGPLAHSTKYFWRVRAVNLIGESGWSEIRTFTTIVAPPGLPQLNFPPDNGTNIPPESDFRWFAVPFAVSYHIQIGWDSSFSPVVWQYFGLPDTSTTVPGLLQDTLYFWRINASNAGGDGPFSAIWKFRTSGPTGIAFDEPLPTTFALGQNFPNPFNPSTHIEFQLPQAEFVTIRVFTLLGSEVAMLVNEQMRQGVHVVTWNASQLPSGVYIYRIHAGVFSQTRRMVLLK